MILDDRASQRSLGRDEYEKFQGIPKKRGIIFLWFRGAITKQLVFLSVQNVVSSNKTMILHTHVSTFAQERRTRPLKNNRIRIVRGSKCCATQLFDGLRITKRHDCWPRNYVHLLRRSRSPDDLPRTSSAFPFSAVFISFYIFRHQN